MSISEWFKRPDKQIKIDQESKRRDVPDGLWMKCEKCQDIVYNKDFIKNLKVCPKCGHHYKIGAYERVAQLFDGCNPYGSSGYPDDSPYKDLYSDLESCDRLSFTALKSYPEVLAESQDKTGLRDSVIVIKGPIHGKTAVVVIMDFRFAGGSLGSVAGEKVTLATELATKEGLPLIIFSASGGARMQEGMFSLMQMAKTSAAIGRHLRAGLTYISVLTNPTTGGVLASYASLAPVIVAEPKALIGFAGKRVIEKTIKQKLPDDFQTAEFLFEQGMIDMIVTRLELRDTLAELI